MYTYIQLLVQEQAEIAGQLQHLQVQKQEILRRIRMPGNSAGSGEAGQEVTQLNVRQGQMGALLAGFVLANGEAAAAGNPKPSGRVNQVKVILF